MQKGLDTQNQETFIRLHMFEPNRQLSTTPTDESRGWKMFLLHETSV